MKRITTLLFILISITCFAQPAVVGLTQNGNKTIPITMGGTNASTANDARDSLQIEDWTIQAYQSLGSALAAQTFDISNITTSVAFNAGSNRAVSWMPIKLVNADTIKGFMWYQKMKGVYTGNNYNGGALCTIVNGVLTVVDSSVNDANIWTVNSETYGKKAFATNYYAQPGVYYLAIIFCYTSSPSTFPSFGARPAVTHQNVYSLDFTNSVKIGLPFLGSQNFIPHSQAMSGLGAQNISLWFGLYH